MRQTAQYPCAALRLHVLDSARRLSTAQCGGDDDTPFMALPIFPNRNFRHATVFGNTEAGIEKPQDLVGKTLGEFALFGHDAGVWPKGILSDEYGVTVDRCRRVIGGTDHPLPAFDRTGAAVRSRQISTGTTDSTDSTDMTESRSRTGDPDRAERAAMGSVIRFHFRGNNNASLHPEPA